MGHILSSSLLFSLFRITFNAHNIYFCNLLSMCLMPHRTYVHRLWDFWLWKRKSSHNVTWWVLVTFKSNTNDSIKSNIWNLMLVYVSYLFTVGSNFMRFVLIFHVPSVLQSLGFFSSLPQYDIGYVVHVGHIGFTVCSASLPLTYLPSV